MKAFLFPGQGSQHVGMGAKLFNLFPKIVAEADEILGYSVELLCLKDLKQQLNNTRFTQPALFVVNALAYRHRLQEDSNILPNFVAGHSLGEYNALESAQVITFADGLRLVKKRAELMSNSEKGIMAAIIGISPTKVLTILSENNLNSIDIANYNSDTQTIISGLETDMYNAQAFFEKNKAMYMPLNVSGAFHSRYMKTAREEFSVFLQNFKFNPPIIPVISNVNAKPYTIDSIKLHLADQLTHSVQWLDSIHFLLNQGVTEFIELGPGDVLTKLVRNIRSKYTEITAQESVDIVSIKENEQKIELEEQIESTVEKPVNNIKSPQQLVDEWNALYPIGTRVIVSGYDDLLITKSNAMILFKHRAAIYMEGYNGYFALSDVKPEQEVLN